MRVIDGFHVDNTAIQEKGSSYRPALSVHTPDGQQTALIALYFLGTVPMDQAAALDASRACLAEAIAVGPGGSHVYLADGNIKVRMVPTFFSPQP